MTPLATLATAFDYFELEQMCLGILLGVVACAFERSGSAGLRPFSTTVVDALFFARSNNRNGKKGNNETWRLLILRRCNHRPATRNINGGRKE